MTGIDLHIGTALLAGPLEAIVAVTVKVLSCLSASDGPTVTFGRIVCSYDRFIKTMSDKN